MPKPKHSAGLLVYRINEGSLRVLLVHPGGPFWARKDAGAWSIPKGEYEADELSLDAARREFKEELGLAVEGPFVALTPIKQAGGKVVAAWACAAEIDVSATTSTKFSMEWPPKSGQLREFPEIDRAEWFTLDEARDKILAGQKPLLDELERLLQSDFGA
jgi:predicted NUDIX family NTP pyrophosphohydrolase